MITYFFKKTYIILPFISHYFVWQLEDSSSGITTSKTSTGISA